MGTINYKSSDYITIGLNVYNPDDFEVEDGEDVYDVIADTIEADREEIQFILNKYNFRFFDVKIEPGYYEGFSIDIFLDYLWYDSWQEKKEVLKEATQVGNFLRECVEYGMCQVYPGWCTTYLSYKESLAGIQKAVREMKEEIRKAPTERTVKFDELWGGKEKAC